MALNYDALTALTRRKHIKKLVDNVFNSTPYLAMLRERAKTYDGGYKIIEPIIMGELSGVKSYAGYDVIDYDENIPITAAEFEPKNVVATVIISKDEELKNQGENQVLSMLESKIKIAELTLKKKLTQQLLGDGTGNSGKDMTGLQAAIADTGTYGGIDRTTYSWWKANVFASPTTSQDLDNKLILKAFMAASDGTEQPNFILCDKKTWMKYHELVRGQIQQQTGPVTKLVSMGFKTLEWMGIPLVYDDNIDETITGGADKGIMYLINTDYMNFRVHKNANFATTKFRPDDTRLARKMEILVTGNLTFNNCRRHAVIKDIDVSDV